MTTQKQFSCVHLFPYSERVTFCWTGQSFQQNPFSIMVAAIYGYYVLNVLYKKRTYNTLQYITNEEFKSLKENKFWAEFCGTPKTYSCSFFRSSRPQVFFKICTVENFSKFTGKHLCSLQLYHKRNAGTGVFFFNFVKCLSATFLKGHLRAAASSF